MVCPLKHLSAELRKDKGIGLEAVARTPASALCVSEELHKELKHLASYWESELHTIACAELNPTLIQLDISMEH